jgi:hypothetical protein
VTNDSGPAQLAALTDVNILVFFGPETPALYRPIADPDRCHVLYSHYACSPCVTAFNQRRTECTDNVCLKSIAVPAVHGMRLPFWNGEISATGTTVRLVRRSRSELTRPTSLVFGTKV